MRRWRIYYDDGFTYSDYDGPIEVARALGVIAITVENPSVGKILVAGKDYYFFDDGIWKNSDIFGLWDHLQQPGMKRVLFGRTIDTEKYDAIMQRAYRDPYPAIKDTDHVHEKSWHEYPDHSASVTFAEIEGAG